MNIRTLISKMEALASPDAEVFFSDDSGKTYAIGGGLLDAEPGTGRIGLILTEEPIVTEGGF
ncbi:hypothetical protein [Brevundimonas naejangsanensis]|uniref:hypothetical protein n=1 Tax=Brevundimonas naejangsanensis TaxID=588932 RepID=UPI0039F6EF60